MKINCKNLPMRLREFCEGTAKKSDGSNFSLEYRKEIIARKLKVSPHEIELPTINNFSYKKDVSRIGTILKEIIEKKNGESIPCADCKADMYTLNTMVSKDVLLNKSVLARKITERGAEKATKWYHRFAAKYTPTLVTKEIERWIEEACLINDTEDLQNTPIECGFVKTYSLYRFLQTTNNVILGSEVSGNRTQILALYEYYNDVKNSILSWADETKRELIWQYGVTTVPFRKGLLNKTLNSLVGAGFDKPIVFVDSEYDDYYDRLNLEIVFRSKNLKAYTNWLLTLSELYLRNPEADRYAVFQDDIVLMKDLKQFLSINEYPKDGYWNLFSFLQNEKLIKDKKGWLKSNQKGQGGLALVFDNNTALTLLTQPHVYTRTWNRDRKDRFIDGAVVEAIKKSGRYEYIHSPSLVQHIGDVSAIGNPKHPQADTFLGENISALTL